MYSIAFPKIFSSTSVNLYKDKEATSSNLKLLLGAAKTSLFGDPYFGTNIKKLTFEQNNQIIKDLVIDDIYIAITTFIPQIKIQRKDITIVSDRAHIYANIKATNLLDYTTNLYSINLTESEEK